jgi:hypothetical protein
MVLKRRGLVRRVLGCIAVLLLLSGCFPGQATLMPTIVPTSTPDPCTGWRCIISGYVYDEMIQPGNGVGGVAVNLRQISWCSPTSGQHQSTSRANGKFSFPVFIHDTDTFWVEVEIDGYEPVRQSIGGFDCLLCHCPPIEIILKSK